MDDKKRRKDENDDIIRRMKLGDPLVRIPQSYTRFPPRPLTKKDRTYAQNKTSNVISLPIRRKPTTPTD
jgi:hypothetical protein